MDYSIYEPIAEGLGISVETAVIIFIIISVWTLIWKGFALWKSCKKNHCIWFIILLIINTIGILEILYIYIFSEIKLQKEVKNKNAKKKSRGSKKGK